MLKRCWLSLDLPTYVNKHSQWWSWTNPETEPLSLMIICQLSFTCAPQTFSLTSVHWSPTQTGFLSLNKKKRTEKSNLIINKRAKALVICFVLVKVNLMLVSEMLKTAKTWSFSKFSFCECWCSDMLPFLCLLHIYSYQNHTIYCFL